MQVYPIAHTELNYVALETMFQELGPEAMEWFVNQNRESEADALHEIAGRICYKSFGTSLNKNVNQTRADQQEYIANILKSGHGSVLEHGTVTFAFMGVSRILTHELVRHRIAGYSQESGRYVRVDSLRFYFPDSIADAAKKYDMPHIQSKFLNALDEAVRRYQDLESQIPWDDMKMDEKKSLTSSLRRILPQGLCCDIIMTANHRSWRQIIQKRCTQHAEEEIRKLFFEVAKNLKKIAPHTYQDFEPVAHINDMQTYTSNYQNV